MNIPTLIGEWTERHFVGVVKMKQCYAAQIDKRKNTKIISEKRTIKLDDDTCKVSQNLQGPFINDVTKLGTLLMS
jgi:hypothetical protein